MTDAIQLSVERLPSLLDWMIRSPIVGAPDWQLMLFQNAIDPDCEVTISDLVECTFGGYARFTLNRTNWQPAQLLECCAYAVYGTVPLSWTNTGAAQQIAGYAMLTPGDNWLIGVQALSVPFMLGTLQTTSLRPQFTLTTGACEES